MLSADKVRLHNEHQVNFNVMQHGDVFITPECATNLYSMWGDQGISCTHIIYWSVCLKN